MECLAYLEGLRERKRDVSSVVEMRDTEAFAFVWQPHPPLQPALVARQLRQIARLTYQVAPATTRPTEISCHSTSAPPACESHATPPYGRMSTMSVDRTAGPRKNRGVEPHDEAA